MRTDRSGLIPIPSRRRNPKEAFPAKTSGGGWRHHRSEFLEVPRSDLGRALDEVALDVHWREMMVRYECLVDAHVHPVVVTYSDKLCTRKESDHGTNGQEVRSPFEDTLQ